MKNIVLIIITFLFLGACTKEGGNIYLEGRVYNPVTGEGIEGIDVFMFKDKVFSGYPSDSKEVGRSTTDADGYYKISHTGGGLVYYVNINSISRTGEEYYKLGWANDNIGLEGKYRFQIPKGKNVTADYEMVPYGGLRYEIKNINCINANDNFKLYYMGTETGYQNDYIGVITIEGEGCFQSNDNSFSKLPIGDRYYKIEITKNGQLTSYLDTITLQENQDYVYEINY